MCDNIKSTYIYETCESNKISNQCQDYALLCQKEADTCFVAQLKGISLLIFAGGF